MKAAKPEPIVVDRNKCQCLSKAKPKARASARHSSSLAKSDFGWFRMTLDALPMLPARQLFWHWTTADWSLARAGMNTNLSGSLFFTYLKFLLILVLLRDLDRVRSSRDLPLRSPTI